MKTAAEKITYNALNEAEKRQVEKEKKEKRKKCETS